MLQKAQLVLLVLDGSSPLTKEDQILLEQTKDKRRLILFNKEDMQHQDKEGIWISAKNHQIQPLLDALENMYNKIF